jgi:tetratricopeptide (TPR) repeat protein
MSLRRWKSIVGLFSLCFLTHCSSGPPPSSLPPSASDLNLLGQAYLCQTETEARARWLKPGSQKTPWGNGSEHFQEIAHPNKQGQWVVFNEDQTLVGVITVFPDGLSLDDYPTLRKTLSQLPPARDFYLTSSQLLDGQVPDSATLYRTGKATTTHQYYLRHRPGQDDQLIMAVFVLDPYESLLDGSHPKFLSYLKTSSTPREGKTSPTTTHGQNDQDFLGLQQFARGEIALFGSCGTKHPDIAQDAYQKAIHYGLSETKQLAEAHHRLGLALIHLNKFPEAKASIEKALAIQPHASNILNSYGTVLVKLDKIPAGIQAYEQALALQPAYSQARFNLAGVFESINPKRAIQEYETFVVLAEDNPDETAKVAIAKAKIKMLQNQ